MTNINICNIVVDTLVADKNISCLLGGNKVYQVVAPKADEYPRVVINEESREYTAFADDKAVMEHFVVKITFYSKENTLTKFTSAINEVLQKAEFRRLSVNQDIFSYDLDIYTKTVLYEKYIELEE